MSVVLSVHRFGNPAGHPAIFSKTEMQLSPFWDATFWNYCLQKTSKGVCSPGGMITSISRIPARIGTDRG